MEEQDKATGRKVEEFFDLEFQKGILKNHHSGTRMLALPLSSWLTLNSALRQSFGDGARVYMHQIGYAIGASVAQEFRANSSPPHSVLMKILPGSVMSAGWGKLAMTEDPKETISLTFKLENCASCSYDQHVTPPLCDILVRMLNGVVDEVFKKPHLVNEFRCGYKTDQVCEFSVVKTYAMPEEQKHWASYVIFPWHRSNR